jgi:hypothetical protein
MSERSYIKITFEKEMPPPETLFGDVVGIVV